MGKAKESSPSGVISWAAVVRGTAVSIIAALLLSLAAGFIFYRTSITESILPWVAAFILFFSTALGGALAAWSAGEKGLYHGLAVGLAFFVLSWLAAATLFPGPLTPLGLAEKFFLSVSAGAVGGILGATLVL